MTAVIVCNGAIRDYTYIKNYLKDADYIICADGGAHHLRNFGIMPDVLLGDFDSISHDDLEFFRNSGVEVLEYPRKKDETDTELAVELAVNKGYMDLVFIGGLGTRLDHSLANVFILKKILDKGVRGTIVDEHNEISIIRDRIELKKEPGIKITLLSLTGKTEGVTTKGLLYPLHEATLEMGSTWGVSNEFLEDIAEVSIKSGLLLVIKSRD